MALSLFSLSGRVSDGSIWEEAECKLDLGWERNLATEATVEGHPEIHNSLLLGLILYQLAELGHGLETPHLS